MSKFHFAAIAAALMFGAAPALSESAVQVSDFAFEAPMVLHIAEGEQVFCGDVGLKKVGDHEYVFSMDAGDDNKDLCAPEPQIQGENILF